MDIRDKCPRPKLSRISKRPIYILMSVADRHDLGFYFRCCDGYVMSAMAHLKGTNTHPNGHMGKKKNCKLNKWLKSIPRV